MDQIQVRQTTTELLVAQGFNASVIPKSFNDIVFNPSIRSFAHYKRCNESEISRRYIIKAIADLAKQVNISKNITETQIYTTADMIQSEYYMLSIDDLYFCFKNGLIGKYGRIYDRLDIAIISEWLSLYLIDRMNHAENIQLQNHKKVTSEEQEKIDEETFQKGIQMLKDSLPKIEEPAKKEIVITDAQKLVARILQQFDNIFPKIGKEVGGTKFVRVNGKYLDRTEFLNYKLR